MGQKFPPVGVPTGDSGIIAAAQRYGASLVRYGSAFLGLLHLDVREAAGIYLLVFVFSIVGLIFAVFGYVFFLLFLAFLCGVFLQVAWYWIALVYAVGHFLLAVFCVWQVKKRVKKPVFVAVSQELQRDVALLSGESCKE